MDSEKLIEIVREYRMQYDLRHPKYSDTKAKELIWLKVAERMEKSVDACKRTWANLREAYRRALKRNATTKSGQAAVITHTWKYEKEMSFLTRNYEERPTLSSIDEDISDEAIFEVSDLYSSPADPITPDQATPDESTLYGATQDQATLDEATPSLSRPEPTSVERPRKERRMAEQKSVSATVMEYFLQMNNAKEKEKEKGKDLDDIEIFVRSVAVELRKLNPINLLRMKQTIYTMVLESYPQQLEDGSNSPEAS